MRQMKRQTIALYVMLQRVTDEIPRHDMIIMGDWNAKIRAT